MPGRYILTCPLDAIRQMAMFDQLTNLPPNCNAAPTHEMPILRRRKGDRRCELAIARWGLIPHWAKDIHIASSTINARSETASWKPDFRDVFKKQHCLIPTDGFYEWKLDGEDRQPHLIRMKGGGVFAGPWSQWKAVTSFTIMTTEPNELMAEIHNRMPVILDEERGMESWLDTSADPAEVLKPCPSYWLEAYPVNKRVGNVRNNDAGLADPIQDID